MIRTNVQPIQCNLDKNISTYYVYLKVRNNLVNQKNFEVLMHALTITIILSVRLLNNEVLYEDNK